MRARPPFVSAAHDAGRVPDRAAEILFLDTHAAGEPPAGVKRYYAFYEPMPMWFPTASPWIYEESNGLDGLQRGGGDYTTNESCGHGPDTIVL